MKPKDELHVGPIMNDEGARPFIGVSPEGEISTGVLSGSHSEKSRALVELEHRGGSRFEVTKVTRFTQYGPAQVASDRYRSGWARVFGGKTTTGQA